MSLGSWFRDYLYIPLGGNRAGRARWLANIFIVWMATGFWHGAAWNFVVWGLMFAVLLTVEKLWLGKLLEKAKVFSHLYVLFFLTLSFVVFDAASVTEALTCIRAMLGGLDFPAVTFESVYYLKSYLVVLLIAVIGATPLPRRLAAAVENGGRTRAAFHIAEPLALTALLAVCTAFLIDGSFNPFLYFRF